MIEREALPHPYDRHVGRYGAQLAAELIAAAEVVPGQRVLDVGCGVGALTIELAQVVGESSVTGVDPSADAIETCRARVPDAELLVAPVEALPFDEQSFDSVLAQLVINLVDDPEAGTREMKRVARSGGAVAACVWDANAMPLLASFWQAAAEVAPEEVGAVDERKQVGLRDSAWLRDLWQTAGLRDVSVGRLATSAGYDDFDDLWYSFEHGVGRSGAVYLSLASERRETLRSRTHELLGSPNGRFHLEAFAWYLKGTAG